MNRLRRWLAAWGTRIANALQPRIARELLSQRPEIHDARQRVWHLVLLTELARSRQKRDDK